MLRYCRDGSPKSGNAKDCAETTVDNISDSIKRLDERNFNTVFI